MICHPFFRLWVKNAVGSRTEKRLTPSEAPADAFTVNASGFADARRGKATPSVLNQYADRRRAPKFPVSVRLWAKITSGWRVWEVERTMAEEPLGRSFAGEVERSTETLKKRPVESEDDSFKETSRGVGTGEASRMQPCMIVRFVVVMMRHERTYIMWFAQTGLLKQR